MPGLYIPLTLAEPGLRDSTYSKIQNATGVLSASGTIVPAVANRLIKVSAWALYTTNTTEVICQFLDGSSPVWTVPLQTVQNTVQGFDMSTALPGFLFCTSVGNALGLNLSPSASVIYNVTFWADDEA